MDLPKKAIFPSKEGCLFLLNFLTLKKSFGIIRGKIV